MRETFVRIGNGTAPAGDQGTRRAGRRGVVDEECSGRGRRGHRPRSRGEGRQATMELASKAPRDNTDAVIIVPPMNKSIKFTLPVKPLDSHLQPE